MPAKEKVQAKQEFYGTGRRKNSVVRLWLKPGVGQILINGQELQKYLCRQSLVIKAERPLMVTGQNNKLTVRALASGGGISGQASAFSHGLARALVDMQEDFRRPLRAAGLLTRDPRAKERKKYGRKRARRGFQFTKR